MITSCAPMPFMRSNIPSPSRSSIPSTCSAGNLFGTTRRSHPGPFGTPPFWRYESTSGGVSASCPGQNGHCSRPRICARSNRKSLGRFWRSVEMITHRPVTGSLRSCGIESVLEDLDRRPASVELDRHDVEAAGGVCESVSHQIVERHSCHAPALQRGNRLGALAERAAVPRLHFDEHDRGSVAGDDVDFASACAVPSCKYCVPAPLQLAAGELLAVFAQDYTGLCHAGRPQQPARHT